MSIQALRERKAALHREANHLLAEKGSQTWSKEDQTKFDGLMDESERVDQQISAHQRLLDADAQANFRDAPKVDPKAKKTELQRGVDLFLRKSFKDLSPEEITLVRNTMSTTTGSQGGYTVQTQVAADYIDAMKDFAGMRRIADRSVTDTGADMSWPSTDGTAEVGEIVAQNASASAADASFGTVPVNTFKFGSKIITVPIELLQDSTIDVVGMVNNRVRQRVGRIQNIKFSIGTGSGEPYGISVAAAVGKTGANGQTVTIVYDDLVDIVDALDVAYLSEPDIGWNFGQTLRKVIRKIKDTAGRPIWTPSYDLGISGRLSDELLGYPVNLNNDMPSPAANAVSLSFGSHKKYLIRDAMELTLFRFDDSAYASKGQVGFLAWARAGGNLLDTSAVKTYKHSAT